MRRRAKVTLMNKKKPTTLYEKLIRFLLDILNKSLGRYLPENFLNNLNKLF